MGRRMSNRQFERAIVTAGHLYTTMDCGCIAFCMYDIPELVKDLRDDLLNQAMQGRVIRRAARGELPPFNCPEHQRVSA